MKMHKTLHGVSAWRRTGVGGTESRDASWAKESHRKGRRMLEHLKPKLKRRFRKTESGMVIVKQERKS